MRHRSPPSQRDAGAALLSVLLLVAVMSVAALVALDAVSRSVSLTKATSERSRAMWSLRSLEEYGGVLMTDLAEQVGAGFTTVSSAALEPRTIPTPDGVIQARLRDATNCFNLNALRIERETDGDSASYQSYLRLLEALEFSPYEARTLGDALLDWMDADQTPRPNGAENPHYGALSPPYRASGQPLENLSELNMIAGYTDDIRLRIREFVCVRPTSDRAVLNVNMLTEEQAALLSALYSQELAIDDARAVIQSRPSTGWETLAEFRDSDIIRQIAPFSRNDDVISLATTHVEMNAVYRTGNGGASLNTLYEWSPAGEPRLVWRRFGGRS